MTRKEQRIANLLPGGIPRYIRAYDNGGKSFDRYTVIFTGRYVGRPRGGCEYVGMSENPCHPQGFGQHGEAREIIDSVGCRPPGIGRSNHLGKRIRFTDLPEPCQRVVMTDYVGMWNLNND